MPFIPVDQSRLSSVAWKSVPPSPAFIASDCICCAGIEADAIRRVSCAVVASMASPNRARMVWKSLVLPMVYAASASADAIGSLHSGSTARKMVVQSM
eukprot:2275961-Prymnesium_polylepis.1